MTIHPQYRATAREFLADHGTPLVVVVANGSAHHRADRARSEAANDRTGHRIVTSALWDDDIHPRLDIHDARGGDLFPLLPLFLEPLARRR